MRRHSAHELLAFLFAPRKVRIYLFLLPEHHWYPALLILVLIPLYVQAKESIPATRSQNPLNFERFSREQGMQGTNVTCILEDLLGVMWFGTSNGLHRYDGYRFTVYRHDVRDTTSISEDHVLALLEDRSGAIWAGTLYQGTEPSGFPPPPLCTPYI